MKNVYIEEPIRRLALQYMKEEDLLALESGEQDRILAIQDKNARAKYEMAIKLMEGLMLCADRDFNRLVEEKAQRYRNGEGKKYMIENYVKNKDFI